MRNSIPRYVFPSTGSSTFEFPVVKEYGRTPSATIAVASETFDDALTSALHWAVAFSAKAKDDQRFFPQVAYGDDRRLVKKIVDGYAWVENNSHGSWVTTARLRHEAAITHGITPDTHPRNLAVSHETAAKLGDPTLSPQQRAWVTIRARRAAAAEAALDAQAGARAQATVNAKLAQKGAA